MHVYVWLYSMHVRMDHHHIYRLALKDEKPEKETDVEDREKQCGIFDACCKKKTNDEQLEPKEWRAYTEGFVFCSLHIAHHSK